ncbi:hypothetical protein M409DRAFT_53918 [Zasmidium cellare ATCC 36951]|uniref:Uncharacterized protein n=1 Tax=Zasmidium cellare ATCC 36951 TaxID=1080233 RepID=A0A6A6CQ81_ZASCE|nr:uncharacterized protein M409DRAFT_53918 [Zasmidium cellare ATCC 36951]KAF2167982.1 hypothetical protein M409DRAFT_53918 [Zasmidium cellare ATCC 36951]
MINEPVKLISLCTLCLLHKASDSQYLMQQQKSVIRTFTMNTRRRFYTNFPPDDPETPSPPLSPPRRTRITGTRAEIEDLRHRKTRITGKGSYAKRIDELAKEHLIQDYDKAERAFATGHYEFCKDQCFFIHASKPLSDTIKAKTYMLLARREVLGDSPEERESYAKEAMKCWDVVIERRGYCHTRFPAEVAREQRKVAKRQLEVAQSDLNSRRKKNIASHSRQDENLDPALQELKARQESQEL